MELSHPMRMGGKSFLHGRTYVLEFLCSRRSDVCPWVVHPREPQRKGSYGGFFVGLHNGTPVVFYAFVYRVEGFANQVFSGGLDLAEGLC